MIVRNEEANLPGCLASAADLVDEIVVVDTGSTDRTKEVAGRLGARVYDFPWCDDFAAARNESLRHATGQWVFWLDADDRVDQQNHRKLHALLAGLKAENVAYLMRCCSSAGATSGSAAAVDHVRLFPCHPEIRWQYRVHEQILPSVQRLGGSLRSTHIVIHHAGYDDALLHRRKLERNLHLLGLSQAEHPDDAFVLYNLGQNYLALGRATEALPHLKRSLERAQPADFFVRKLYAQLARGYCQLGRWSQALAVCRQAQSRWADYAELVFLEGQLLSDQGDLAGAEACFARLLQPGAGFRSDDLGLCGYKARQNLASICHRQGRQAEAEAQWRAVVAEKPDFAPAWLALADLCLSQNRPQEVQQAAEHLRGQTAAWAAALAGVLQARLHISRREFAAAKALLTAIAAADPQAFWPRVLLGDLLLWERQDWGAAERLLREVLSLNPDHQPTRRKLALLLEQRGSSTPSAQ
jgi:tetratricopeptide (TPR) repeat protein